MKKLLHSLVAGASLLALSAQAGPIQITVDPNTALCTNFLGFGVQWSPYPWFDITDQAWENNFKRLDYMRPALVRVMTRAYKYCDGFDAQGKPIYQWENNRMKKLYRLLAYCQQHNVVVIIGEWDDPSSTGDRVDKAADKLQPYKIDCTDRRWSRLIGDFLEHLIKDKGYTCLKYYNLINEPNGSWSACADFRKWNTAISNLHAELKQRDLIKFIQLTGPDSCQEEDSYWLDLAVRYSADHLGLYDVHEYAKVADVESGWLEVFYHTKRKFIDRYDWQGWKKPLVISEAGIERTGPGDPQGGRDSQMRVYDPIYGILMSDYAIQCSRAGVAGILAWDLDDAMHIMNEDRGWPDIHKTLFKKWGFWNSLGNEIGHPEDTKLRPWFYSWSLMSRYFPAGCQIVQSSEIGVPGLRSLAARIGLNNFTIGLVNDSDKPQSLKVIFADWKIGLSMKRYNYSSDDRLVNADGFPVPKQILSPADFASGLAVELPARSFVLLTTLPD
ncbi:MAG: hypothetical protein WCS42_06595 [Verrucomicrobiota bacterium]